MVEIVPSFDALKEALLDLSQPMGKRTRAVFYLRTRGQSSDLQVLLTALRNKKDSELMRHELAYVIGQFQNAEACDTLQSIIEDENDDCMVRHEAAEALGAIGHEKSLAVLEKYTKDPAPEVSQTCELAIELIKYRMAKEKDQLNEPENDRNPYLSVDPAPAAGKHVPTEVLKATLLDSKASLFDRYRAMFSLRNRNTPEAALALAEGFQDESNLFRHEIAYVMGQMANVVTVPSLKAVLMNHNEHRMVRHEAAEALGAIGTPECEEILQAYLKDEHQVVRESCEVALDIMNYWAPTK